MILLVGNIKGGTGKSTVAQLLAVWLKWLGYDVLLVDADPQLTSSQWAAERAAFINEGGSGVAVPWAILHGEISTQLKDFRTRYDHIIIDVGATDSIAMRHAMAVADYMVLPFCPKRRDLKTLPQVVSLIGQAHAVNPSLQVRALVNRCPSLPNRVARILATKETIRAWGIPTLDSVLFDRQAYDDTDENGSSVWEFSDPKAIEDATAVVHELWAKEPWMDEAQQRVGA